MSQIPRLDDFSYRAGAVRNIASVAFPDFLMLDVCGPFEVFAGADVWLRKTGKVDRPVYHLDVIAPQAGPLRTSSGLQIVADHAYPEFDQPIDTLIVAGSSDEEGVERACADAALISWIKETAARARRVASVCSGAFLLAESGLLDGRRATTHWAFSKRLASAYPSVCVEADQIFIRDGHIYTSGGVTAGIDLALALVEEDLGRDIARLTARIMVMFLRQPGGQSQFSTYLGSEADALRDSRWFQTWVLGQPDANLSREVRSSLRAEAPIGSICAD